MTNESHMSAVFPMLSPCFRFAFCLFPRDAAKTLARTARSPADAANVSFRLCEFI